jgi:hypothetical protein
MATTLLEQTSQASGAQTPGAGERIADVGAQAAQFATDDVYYPVGTKRLVEKIHSSDAYNTMKDSQFAQNLRNNYKELIEKINKGGAAVDNFFARAWKGAVGKVKGGYNWTAGNIKSGYHGTKKFLGFKDTGATATGGEAAAVTNTVKEGAVIADAAAGGTIATKAAAETTTVAAVTETTAIRGASEVGLLGRAWGLLGKIGSKVAIPLTLLVGAFQTKRAYTTGNGHGAAKAAGGTLGAIGGGLLAGATEGLIVGGLLGTLTVPLFGSIVLGIGGAIIGGWMGAKVSDKMIGKSLQGRIDAGKAHEKAIHAKELLRVRSTHPEMAAEYAFADNGVQGKGKDFFQNRVIEQSQQAAGNALAK